MIILCPTCGTNLILTVVIIDGKEIIYCGCQCHKEQDNSFPCVECGEVYTEESGAYEGFVCDICIAKQSEQTLKIIDHDFVDANTLCVLVKDTKTGETFNGLLIKEE